MFRLSHRRHPMQVRGVGAWGWWQRSERGERSDDRGTPEEAFAVAEEVGGRVWRVGEVSTEDLIMSLA